MRDITETIDKILRLIPKEESTLLNGLESIQHTAFYAAPETQAVLWAQAAEILMRAIPTPKKLWHHDVVAIWLGKPLDAVTLRRVADCQAPEYDDDVPSTEQFAAAVLELLASVKYAIDILGDVIGSTGPLYGYDDQLKAALKSLEAAVDKMEKAPDPV